MEMLIREWLQLQDPDLNSRGILTRAKLGENH
jgi:hypothetical protein